MEALGAPFEGLLGKLCLEAEHDSANKMVMGSFRGQFGHPLMGFCHPVKGFLPMVT